ncbi:hypothetical protein NE237_015753 [Protea cynaroides]|uniref:S-protein homolog n=1 Tax=Protea cynaroides TaxID=273540 RepID=A0A9Q0KEL6_9MAGN|nr:hypothetical protein NE237_015753 [Protea cynaroides]
MNTLKLILVLAFSTFILSEPYFVQGKYHVHVINDLGPNQILNLHCKSKDDDLGFHTLGYGQEFSWKFNMNIIYTTLFWCNMDWGIKHGSFQIFYEGDQFESCGDGADFGGDCFRKLRSPLLLLKRCVEETADVIRALEEATTTESAMIDGHQVRRYVSYENDEEDEVAKRLRRNQLMRQLKVKTKWEECGLIAGKKAIENFDLGSDRFSKKQKLWYGQEFSWSFHINFAMSTLYWCDFQWGGYVQGSFEIYDARKELLKKSNLHFRKVRQDGIYFSDNSGSDEPHAVDPWPPSSSN